MLRIADVSLYGHHKNYIKKKEDLSIVKCIYDYAAPGIVYIRSIYSDIGIGDLYSVSGN